MRAADADMMACATLQLEGKLQGLGRAIRRAQDGSNAALKLRLLGERTDTYLE